MMKSKQLGMFKQMKNNQWGSLSEYAKVEWALILALYQPQPVAWYVTECSTLLDEHEAEAKRCGGSAKAVPLFTKRMI